jgi:CRP/FNR family transcriptional regulator, anaerobic regulatory protein
MLDKETSLVFGLQSNCRKCSLKSLCLPDGIVDFQLHMFEDIVRHLPVMDDMRYLYYQGDEFINLYVVRSGCVKQIHHSQDGNEQVIGFSFPGELMGIDAIAAGFYVESAITLGTTTVCKIEYARFEELCEKIPGLVKQVLKRASQELIEEHDIRYSISAKNSQERLAMFFSSLSTRFRLLGYSPYEFLLPMSRGDVGNYLGLAVETVSRSTKILVEKGLIEIKKRSVKIRDLDGLKALSGHCDVCPSLKISNSR